MIILILILCAIVFIGALFSVDKTGAEDGICDYDYVGVDDED